jgi:hypothetical protein
MTLFRHFGSKVSGVSRYCVGTLVMWCRGAKGLKFTKVNLPCARAVSQSFSHLFTASLSSQK